MNAERRPNLVLIGLRGSGKSTLGRLVAERLGWAFNDLDDRTAAHLGHPTVAGAWAAAGEPGFRAAEVVVLRDALKETNTVIALGGGTPTAPGAADLLRDAVASQCAITVYLRCSPDELRSRLAAGGGAGANRPSLTGRGALEEIHEVYARRDPLYRSLATHTLDGADASAERLHGLISPTNA